MATTQLPVAAEMSPDVAAAVDQAIAARKAPEPEKEPAKAAEVITSAAKVPAVEEKAKEPVKEPAPDPDTAARLKILAGQKARMDQELADREAALVAREQALLAKENDPGRAKTEQALSRLVEDPIGALVAAGYKNWTDIANKAIGLAMGDKAPPDVKAYLDRQEQRQALTPLEERLNKQDEIIAQLLAEKEQAKVKQEFTGEASGLFATATAADYPVTRSYLDDKREGELLEGLRAYHDQIKEKTGQVVPLADALVMFEKDLQASLPSAAVAALRTIRKTDDASPTAGEKKTAAASLDNNGAASPTPPNPPKKSKKERIREVIAEEEARLRTGG